MADKFPPAQQRVVLERFAAALNSSPRALRRDECGDRRIGGSRGHIYATGAGYWLYHVAGSKQAWTWAKKALSFAKVTQDGDDEGFLFLDRLPTEAEAETIRHYLGIRKRADLSDEERSRRREVGQRLARKAPCDRPEGDSAIPLPGDFLGRNPASPSEVAAEAVDA